MRRKFSVLLVLAAWLLATGSQWDLAQTFAWGRMIAINSHSMPLVRAVRKAFNGEMCSVCLAVQQARQQQDAAGIPAPDGKFTGKILLATAPASAFHLSPAPVGAGLIPSVAAPSSAELPAPPSPPPRAPA